MPPRQPTFNFGPPKSYHMSLKRIPPPDKPGKMPAVPNAFDFKALKNPPPYKCLCSFVRDVSVVVPAQEQTAVTTLNFWNIFRMSPFFVPYSNLYDKFALKAVRIRLTGKQAGTVTTAQNCATVATSFDRNGHDLDQVINYANITTYSTSDTKNWSLGNAFVLFRELYVQEPQELLSIIPAASLEDPQEDPTPANPCVNYSYPSLAWKPLCHVGISVPAVAESDQVFMFDCAYDYIMEFQDTRIPANLISPRNALVTITSVSFDLGSAVRGPLFTSDLISHQVGIQQTAAITVPAHKCGILLMFYTGQWDLRVVLNHDEDEHQYTTYCSSSTYWSSDPAHIDTTYVPIPDAFEPDDSNFTITLHDSENTTILYTLQRPYPIANDLSVADIVCEGKYIRFAYLPD